MVFVIHFDFCVSDVLRESFAEGAYLESCRSQVDICVHKTRDNSQRLPCLLCVA